ncbi:MAG TPA: hypothetical protein VF064_01275 [Pyrinomonadaceae bacterium]
MCAAVPVGASAGLAGGAASWTATTRTSVPAGHVRAHTARTASPAPSDPSTPTMILGASSSRLSKPRRPTRTEQRASSATFFDTLPWKNRPIAERPRVPTTTRLAAHVSALPSNATDGSPVNASASTSHRGKQACTRQPASDDSLCAFATSRVVSSRTNAMADTTLRALTAFSMSWWLAGKGLNLRLPATVAIRNRPTSGKPARGRSSSAAAAHSDPS